MGHKAPERTQGGHVTLLTGETGEIVGCGQGNILMIALDKEFLGGPFDDGMREVTEDQLVPLKK